MKFFSVFLTSNRNFWHCEYRIELETNKIDDVRITKNFRHKLEFLGKISVSYLAFLRKNGFLR